MAKLTYSYIMEEWFGAKPIRRRSLIVEADAAPDRSQFASTAAWQAAVLKLTHGGFGRYVDSNGNYVARSVPQGDDMVLVKITGDEDTGSTKSADGSVDLTPDDQSDFKVSKGPRTTQTMQDYMANPDQYKRDLQLVFKNELKNADRYRKSNRKVATVKGVAYYPISGSLPGLVNTTMSAKLPSHLMIGNQIYPLSGDNYNLVDLTKQTAVEFMNDLTSQAASAPKAAPKAAEKPVPAEPAPETPKADKTAEEKEKVRLQKLSDAISRDLVDYKTNPYPSGDSRKARVKLKTPEKEQAIEKAVSDVTNFLAAPSFEKALDLVTTYNIKFNSVASRITFDSLSALNDKPSGAATAKTKEGEERYEEFFNTSTNIWGAGKNDAQSVKMQLIKTLTEYGGQEVLDKIGGNTSLTSFTKPAVILKGLPETALNVKEYKDERGNVMMDVGGLKFPVFFEYSDKFLDQELQQYINEAAFLDEGLRRRAGIPLTANAPEIDQKAATISESVLIYQKRLAALRTMSDESFVKLDGVATLPDAVARFKQGVLTSIAKVGKPLDDRTRALFDNFDALAEVPENSTRAEREADFEAKWKKFAADLLSHPDQEIIDTRSSLAEIMAVLMELREDRACYVPMKGNLKTIDLVSLVDMANFSSRTIDDLLDVEDNIKLLTTTMDLVSVKSSIDEKGGAGIGATPSMAGVFKLTPIDPKVVRKDYVDYYSKPRTERPSATEFSKMLLQDPDFISFACDYFEISEEISLTARARLLRKKIEEEFVPTKKLPKNATEDEIRMAAREAKDKFPVVFVGKMGEAILNRGVTQQLIENVKFTKDEITSSRDVGTIPFRYEVSSLENYKVSLQNPVSPEEARQYSSTLAKRAKSRKLTT